MRIVAIDPGTTCGWAVYDSVTKELTHGSWSIKVQEGESADMRLLRLQQALNAIGPVDLIAYEAAREGKYAKAVRIQGQLEATIMLWARNRVPQVPFYGANPAVVLSWLCGKGYLTQLRAWQKAEQAAGRKKPTVKHLKAWYAYEHLNYRGDVTDHDRVDAYILCCWIIHNELPKLEGADDASDSRP